MCKFLFLIAAFAVLSPSFSHAANGRVGFHNSAAGAKRTEIPFKLAKIEALNRELQKQGRETIEYHAYSLSFFFDTSTLDFEFIGLSKTQFLAIRAAYGNVTPLEPKAIKANYSLSDFLPPAIQALNGHTFTYKEGTLPQINEGRTGKYPAADSPITERINTSVNCWGTAYSVIQGFGPRAVVPDKFTVFFTGRMQASDFFSSLGTEVGSGFSGFKRGDSGN